MVLGFRVTYYGNGVGGHDPSPMCPCSACWNAVPAVSAPQCPCTACWNAPAGVNPHARRPKQPEQQQPEALASSAASIASSTSSSSSSSSSSVKAKKHFHLGHLLRRHSNESIRSDMVPLRNATTLESTSDAASIMSRP